MFDDNIKMLDYYFFGIGIVSLIAAFFMLLDGAAAAGFIVFYVSCFVVSIFLSRSTIRKIKEIYFWDTGNYIISHAVIGAISAALAAPTLLLVNETNELMFYFLITNLILMVAMLFIMYVQFRRGPENNVSKLRKNLG
jgi:hypothetical protein